MLLVIQMHVSLCACIDITLYLYLFVASSSYSTSSSSIGPIAPDVLWIAVDWVMRGTCTGVSNQGQFKSCWAFSSAVTAKGINFTETITLLKLSEQQLCECKLFRMLIFVLHQQQGIMNCLEYSVQNSVDKSICVIFLYLNY